MKPALALSLALAALLLGSLKYQASADDRPTPIAVKVPDRKEPVSYATEVAEFLEAKCAGCHGATLSENRLNLESVAGMLRGGKRGPSIVVGKADESLVFRMAAHRFEPVMPPKDKKEQESLTPDELGLLKLWIDAGARDDSEAVPTKGRPIELGTLPAGVHPVVALDLNAEGTRVAAGRGNVVQLFDVDSGLEINTLGGHKDIVQSVRFSPDGSLLAAGSYQYVTLWKVPRGGLKQTCAGHDAEVRAVVAMPGGQGFVSAGLDKIVRFWDTDGQPTRQFNTPAPVQGLAVSHDGKRLAVAGVDNVVRVLSVESGSEQFALKGSQDPVNGVSFARQGEGEGENQRLTSVANDGTLRIWSLTVEAGKEPTEPVVLKVDGDAKPLRSIAVRPDGQRVATGSESGAIRVWDVARRSLIESATMEGSVLALSYNPDGTLLLAGGSDRVARVYQSDGLKLRHTLIGHNAPVSSVGFSPGGNTLATASIDGGVKVWETSSGVGVIAFGHKAANEEQGKPIQGVAFIADDTLVTASADKTLKVWSVSGRWAELAPLGPHIFRVLCLDFSPDGSLLAAGGGEPSRSGELKLWEVAGGKLAREFTGLHSDTVFAARFSPDGKALATGAADKLLKVVDPNDGREFKKFEGHTHHVLCLDWKRDGTQIASGGGDSALKIWDFKTGEQVKTLTGAAKQVTALNWLSIKDKPLIVAASGDQAVRIWNPDNGERGQVTRALNGPADYLFCLATSRDGLRLAAGAADGVIWVWNTENGQVVRKLEPARP